MIIVKYNKKTKDIKCKCGGDVWADGSGTFTTPIGFGNVGGGQFGVDKMEYTGWIGQCEVCKKKVMAWISRKVVTKIIALKV